MVNFIFQFQLYFLLELSFLQQSIDDKEKYWHSNLTIKLSNAYEIKKNVFLNGTYFTHIQEVIYDKNQRQDLMIHVQAPTYVLAWKMI